MEKTALQPVQFLSASFFAVGGLEGMGASFGLFIALIIALISGELFQRLSGNPKLVIKMPDGVPPAVAKIICGIITSNDYNQFI